MGKILNNSSVQLTFISKIYHKIHDGYNNQVNADLGIVQAWGHCWTRAAFTACVAAGTALTIANIAGVVFGKLSCSIANTFDHKRLADFMDKFSHDNAVKCWSNLGIGFMSFLSIFAPSYTQKFRNSSHNAPTASPPPSSPLMSSQLPPQVPFNALV
ncbi:MAG: hypothetical protein ACQEP8_03390 [Chlamydiota bacterium]